MEGLRRCSYMDEYIYVYIYIYIYVCICILTYIYSDRYVEGCDMVRGEVYTSKLEVSLMLSKYNNRKSNR